MVQLTKFICPVRAFLPHLSAKKAPLHVISKNKTSLVVGWPQKTSYKRKRRGRRRVKKTNSGLRPFITLASSYAGVETVYGVMEPGKMVIMLSCRKSKRYSNYSKLQLLLKRNGVLMYWWLIHWLYFPLSEWVRHVIVWCYQVTSNLMRLSRNARSSLALPPFN